MKSQENRRSPRAKHDSVLEIFDGDGHLIVGIGRLVNFSNTGLCFTSAKTLRQGKKLWARIRLMKDGAMEASAKVVWARKLHNTTLYGIEFESIQRIQTGVI